MYVCAPNPPITTLAKLSVKMFWTAALSCASCQPLPEEVLRTIFCATSKVSERDADWSFYHAAIMRPLVHDLIVVEVSSHTAKMVPVQSYNSFLDQRSRKIVV